MIDLDRLQRLYDDFQSGKFSLQTAWAIADQTPAVLAELRLLRQVLACAQTLVGFARKDRLTKRLVSLLDIAVQQFDDAERLAKTPQVPATNDPVTPLGEKQ